MDRELSRQRQFHVFLDCQKMGMQEMRSAAANHGLKPITRFTGWSMFFKNRKYGEAGEPMYLPENGLYRDRLRFSICDEWNESKTIDRNELLVLDCEAWYPKINMPLDQVRKQISWIMEAADLCRECAPHKMISFYGGPPVVYHEIVNAADNYYGTEIAKRELYESQLDSWQQHSERLTNGFPRGWMDVQDFLTPSLYTSWEITDEASFKKWATYAEKKIQVCRQFQRRIYCYMWDLVSGRNIPIPDDYWIRMLDFVYARADGLILWTHETWKEDAPALVKTAEWFQQQRELLQ